MYNRTLCDVQYTKYNVRRILWTVLYIIVRTPCTVYNVYYVITLYAVQYTVYTVQCTLYSVQFTD